MVATDLTRPARPGLREQLLAAYTGAWTALIAVAAVCALIPAARSIAHHELALALHVRLRPAPHPTIAAAGWLLANNLRATGWPLLAVLARAQHPGWLRRLITVATATSLAINLLPVAAAIGTYRARLVPYLPHLPLELWAMAAGPALWVISTRQPVTRRALALTAGTILAALTAAALLETWAVPHR